ncbi:hypothetical protein L0F63_004904 [Massospora cicadina]|nr:hypothetical protein L0F63_004904 [Massospora cicadina]
MEEPERQASSESDISCQECIVGLKQEDEDDITTRRVSSLNVSAIGLSSFKRGSVIERLHELKYNSSSRPSFYQAAVDAIYLPRSGDSKGSRTHRALPRRTSFPTLSKREPFAKTPTLNQGQTPSQNQGELSGNESDDEASLGDLADASSPWVPFEASPTTRPSETMTRSKSWDNQSLNEEEMMWLWGGMGYGLQEHTVGTNSLQPNNDPEPRPKLITQLTSNLRQFGSRESIPATPVSNAHDVPMRSPSGSIVSVSIACQFTEDEAQGTSRREIELCGDVADSAYPPPSGSELPRFDFCTQTKVMSNLSFEYLVGLGAHFSYWSNRDLTSALQPN